MNEHKRSEGSRCKGSRNMAGCQQTEAACARLGSCCGACSHWKNWTADGEPPRLSTEVGGRPVTSCEPCRFQRIACTHRLAS